MRKEGPSKRGGEHSNLRICPIQVWNDSEYVCHLELKLPSTIDIFRSKAPIGQQYDCGDYETHHHSQNQINQSNHNEDYRHNHNDDNCPDHI